LVQVWTSVALLKFKCCVGDVLLYNQLFKILQVSTDERLQLLTEPPKTPSVDNVWKWADAFVNKDYLSDILAYIEYPQKLQPSPVNFSSLVISQ